MHGTLSGGRARFDAATRDAEINGKPQRVEPLANDQLDPSVHELVRKVHAPIGAYTPVEVDPYFRTMARHPELFQRQLEMGTSLFTGLIAARQREIAVLRVAWVLGAPFEWGEHVLIAKRYGVAPHEIERVIEGATADGWSRHEAAILGAVDELLTNQTISDEIWEVLAQHWDEAQLIEFPMVIGQYVATALLQNTLRIRLSDNNAGLSQR